MLFLCSFTCDFLPWCWSVPIALSVSILLCYFFSFYELSKDLTDFMCGLISTPVNWEQHLHCQYVFQMSINKYTSRENKFFLGEITVEKNHVKTRFTVESELVERWCLSHNTLCCKSKYERCAVSAVLWSMSPCQCLGIAFSHICSFLMCLPKMLEEIVSSHLNIFVCFQVFFFF